MALSVVDLYRQVLPRTNCGDCGYPTCMAFASMVVSNNKIIMATSGKRETIDGHAQSMLGACGSVLKSAFLEGCQRAGLFDVIAEGGAAP